MSNPVVAEVLGSWLADSAGAEALMRHLVADHTHLDLKEDAKVWGECGGGGAGPRAPPGGRPHTYRPK